MSEEVGVHLQGDQSLAQLGTALRRATSQPRWLRAVTQWLVCFMRVSVVMIGCKVLSWAAIACHIDSVLSLANAESLKSDKFIFFFVSSPSSPNRYKANLVQQGPPRRPDGEVSSTLCRVTVVLWCCKGQAVGSSPWAFAGRIGGCTCAPPHFVMKAESATLPCCAISIFAVRELKM